MDNRTRRDNEMAYIGDFAVLSEQFFNKTLLKSLNRALPFNVFKQQLIFKLIGLKHGKNILVEPPFHCDYGKHIEIGDNFYANTNCTMVDVAKITIGDNVFLGPNVTLCTAGHPIHHKARNTRYEYGIPVTVGNNVWLGAGVIVVPGVTIGDNTVIGAGSVVTKDIPSGVVAVGNPCRVLREIKDEEINYFYKDRLFDEEAMKAIDKVR